MENIIRTKDVMPAIISWNSTKMLFSILFWILWQTIYSWWFSPGHYEKWVSYIVVGTDTVEYSLLRETEKTYILILTHQ